ncbi:hypothetical protein CF319_g6147 [Tilletia indica]|nr:hypothetical protein CF319_g6147 [Tilletia indica]
MASNTPASTSIIIPQRVGDKPAKQRTESTEVDPTLNEVVLVWRLLQLLRHDLNSLKDKTYLNDAVVNFGIHYLISEPLPFFRPPPPNRPKEEDVTILDPSMFSLLLDNKDVSRWMRNIDVFSTTYLIVPVVQQNHWSLIVVVNASLLLQPSPSAYAETSSSRNVQERSTSVIREPESKRPRIDPNPRRIRPYKFPPFPPPGHPPNQSLPLLRRTDFFEPLFPKASTSTSLEHPPMPTASRLSAPLPSDRPVFLRFDSAFTPPSHHTKVLHEFLLSEATTKKKPQLESAGVSWIDSDSRTLRRATARLPRPEEVTARVPQQSGGYDCGLYVLHFVERFFSDPPAFLNLIMVS